MMKEAWKVIPGYEGLYEASSYGRIRSARRHGTPGGILTPVEGLQGYYMVNLCKGGRSKSLAVHGLVAAAFYGPAEGREVDHVNRDRLDNRLGNLRYVPSSLNRALAGKPCMGYLDGVPVARVESAATLAMIAGKRAKQVRLYLRHDGFNHNGVLWKYC